MELKEIKQIIELMNANGLSEFNLERENFKIRLKKGMDESAIVKAIAAAAPPAAAPLPAPAPALAIAAPAVSAAAAPGSAAAGVPTPAARDGEPVPEPEVTPVGPSINSPMVGTYYRSASPEDPPFLKVGDSVDEETVVCIIESMKVMNEIKAETRGTVAKILVDDATAVQYGQPLIELQP